MTQLDAKQDAAPSRNSVKPDDLAQPEVQQATSATNPSATNPSATNPSAATNAAATQVKYAFTRSEILETYEKGPEAVVELVEMLVSENNAMAELVQNMTSLTTQMTQLEQTINQLYRDRGQLPPALGFGKHAKRSRPKK